MRIIQILLATYAPGLALLGFVAAITMTLTGCGELHPLVREYRVDKSELAYDSDELSEAELDYAMAVPRPEGHDPLEYEPPTTEEEVDDDCLSWERRLRDLDGDGYGDPDNYILVRVCEPWETGFVQWVDGRDDCDDSNWKTHPGAAEWCDFEDNDCDGLIETVDPDAVDIIYHDDDDGDGYGAAFGQGGFGCNMSGYIPPGHARNPDDCDDQDPLVTNECYAL